MKPGPGPLRRLWLATGYSFSGLAAAARHEAAFRLELLVVLPLLVASFWVARGPLEWLLLVAPLVLMMVVELLNSAVETTLDRVGTQFNELAGRAKDMGSAAVFLSVLLAALCWGTILWSHAHA